MSSHAIQNTRSPYATVPWVQLYMHSWHGRVVVDVTQNLVGPVLTSPLHCNSALGDANLPGHQHRHQLHQLHLAHPSTSAHCVSSRVRALQTSYVCLVLCSCSSNTFHSTSTSILFVRGLWLCLLASPACDSVMTPHSHPILSLPAPRYHYPLLCTTCTRYFR